MRPVSPYRHLSTRDLLAAKECAAWDRTDLADNPAGWDFPQQSADYLAVVAAEIEAELARRERRRDHPLAPPWPGDRGEVEEIKRRIDLAAYVERTTAIQLRKVGRQLLGYCPFPDHHAHSWGFVVHPEKQVFHCFGCLRGGDVFDFAGEWLGLDFPVVVDLLAREAGMPRAVRGAGSGLSRARRERARWLRRPTSSTTRATSPSRPAGTSTASAGLGAAGRRSPCSTAARSSRPPASTSIARRNALAPVGGGALAAWAIFWPISIVAVLAGLVDAGGS